jgi:hypothetical protein
MSQYAELKARLRNHSVADDAAQWQAADAIEALEAKAILLSATVTSMQREIDELRGLKPRILSAFDDYAGITPEEGESWESWFLAAFDLAKQRVSNIIDAALSRPPGDAP